MKKSPSLETTGSVLTSLLIGVGSRKVPSAGPTKLLRNVCFTSWPYMGHGESSSTVGSECAGVLPTSRNPKTKAASAVERIARSDEGRVVLVSLRDRFGRLLVNRSELSSAVVLPGHCVRIRLSIPTDLHLTGRASIWELR